MYEICYRQSQKVCSIYEYIYMTSSFLKGAKSIFDENNFIDVNALIIYWSTNIAMIKWIQTHKKPQNNRKLKQSK